jgi:hypothetical protein
MLVAFTSFLLARLLVTTSPSPGPTLAVEDTLHTQVPEVLVRAPRVTLAEILDRVARGEARRESLMTDQSFTASVTVVGNVMSSKHPPRMLDETVWRVYRKQPDRIRTVQLRHRQYKPPKHEKANADVDIDFDPGMGEEIVNFAFKPEERRNFRYQIVGRDLVGGHLIYRMSFDSRSNIDPFTPGGLVWIDTNDFVILREEVHFRLSPIPLMLKSIDRMVVERGQVDGHWVLNRVLVRGELTVPMPTIGKSFDVVIQYRDYQINAGLPDSLFKHTR